MRNLVSSQQQPWRRIRLSCFVGENTEAQSTDLACPGLHMALHSEEQKAGLAEMFPTPNKEGWYQNIISIPGEVSTLVALNCPGSVNTPFAEGPQRGL